MSVGDVVWTVVCTGRRRMAPPELRRIMSQAHAITCANVTQVCHTLKAHQVGVLLWDLNGVHEGELTEGLAHINAASPETPLILCIDLTHRVARQLAAVASVPISPQLAVYGYDDIPNMTEALREGQIPVPAFRAMAEPLLQSTPRDGQWIVAAAIVTGHQRLTSLAFAELCNTPRRTLEWRLASIQMPAPGRLLGMMLSLHGLWRLDILEWSVKQVASASGFTSARTWSNYLERHTKARPLALIAGGGFSAYLQRVAAMLSQD